MQPPSIIVVGNHRYDVILGKIRRAGQGYMGRTKTGKTKIWLDDNLAASVVRETALHEVIHAVVGDTPMRDAENEEAMVRAVTPGLLFVLRNNPDFVKFLLED